jgi:hypothetical protein
MMRGALVFALAIASVNGGGDDERGGDAKGSAARRPPPDAFTGISIAAHASDMFGVDPSFRIAGWNSGGGWSKLLELAPDGTAVKQGDVVARFDFQGKEALDMVNQRIASAEAKASAAKIDAQQAVDALVLDEKKKEIDADLARIDTEKERALSKRQAEQNRIAKKIADFEVSAVKERIDAAEKKNEAERSYQDVNVERAKKSLGHYAFYEKRFVLTAPHDGIVRHAFNGREGRKIQKGDAVPAGMKVMSVAKDALLAARIFVPEHRIHELEVGSIVVVTTAGSKKAHRAKVASIDYFPQEIGYLLENEDLPNAREKAFAVTADFIDPVDDLTAGVELVVRKASE